MLGRLPGESLCPAGPLWRRATAAALKSQIWACAHVAHKWMPPWRAGHGRYPSSSPFPGVFAPQAWLFAVPPLALPAGRAPLELYRLLQGRCYSGLVKTSKSGRLARWALRDRGTSHGHPQAISPETWKAVEAAICIGGLGYSECGRNFGIGAHAIIMKAKRHGWAVPRESQSARERYKPVTRRVKVTAIVTKR